MNRTIPNVVRFTLAFARRTEVGRGDRASYDVSWIAPRAALDNISPHIEDIAMATKFS